jgi:hypothetical protein
MTFGSFGLTLFGRLPKQDLEQYFPFPLLISLDGTWKGVWHVKQFAITNGIVIAQGYVYFNARIVHYVNKLSTKGSVACESDN